MKYYRYMHDMHNNKEIKPEDMQTFCEELGEAIRETSLFGKSEAEIFGEIYTRTRTRIWYRIKYEDYIHRLFRCGMGSMERNMPKELKGIVKYIFERTLSKNVSEDSDLNMKMHFAGMQFAIDEMNDVNKASERLNKELAKRN